MRFHAAGEGDGGWRIIEVWESREGFDRFIEEDLAAAFPVTPSKPQRSEDVPVTVSGPGRPLTSACQAT